MEDARRLRKMLGAGMRQAGIIAAAALYGIAHHRARLAEDHEHARLFFQAMRAGLDAREVTLLEPETNIVSIDLPAAVADLAMARAKADGLLISAIVPTRLRAVFHLDVSRTETATAAETLLRAIRAASSAR
jgi:threonine aldolase